MLAGAQLAGERSFDQPLPLKLTKNTIGAAIGSLVCGFWLIDALGVWGSLSFAIGLNFIIGMVCIFSERVISRKKNLPDAVSAKGLMAREKSSLSMGLDRR